MKAVIGKYQRRLFQAWLALLALLALTLGGAFIPLGMDGNFALAIAIASLKAAIIIAVFMQPAKERRLGIVFSLTGIFWLVLMLALMSADYLTRSSDFVRS